jgi:Zn-dependent M28 family amino/carboxypeptidase
MGVWGPARDFSMSGNAQLQLLDMLVAEAQRQGRTFTPESNPGAGLFFRSDHFPFAKAGVPAVSFKPGQNLVTGGVARGSAIAAEYTKNRYHQPDDEYQPDWNFTGMAADARLLHAVGYNLANSAAWPSWGPGSEFGIEREKTAGERSGSAPATTPSPVATPPAKGERG